VSAIAALLAVLAARLFMVVSDVAEEILTMFHTYVFAQSGNKVDFDRASFLMDRDLLKASIEAMRHERDTCPRWDATYGAQWVWDYYCERHFELYSEYFVPDVDPTWDQPGPLPSKKPEIDLGPNPEQFIRVLEGPLSVPVPANRISKPKYSGSGAAQGRKRRR
jgi:hypothetical protein